MDNRKWHAALLVATGGMIAALACSIAGNGGTVATDRSGDDPTARLAPQPVRYHCRDEAGDGAACHYLAALDRREGFVPFPPRT